MNTGLDALAALWMAGFVLSVLALFAWVFTVFAVSYVLYKYVWTPWKVVRTDITALANKVRIMEANMNRNQAQTALSDEQTARVEARLRARDRASMAGHD